MDVSKDEIVITGVSGRFPMSENVEEFKENLFNGVNMISMIRPPLNEGELPYMGGKLKNHSKFDANFFGVHPRLANCMEPQIRILLETVYEAIVDAGVNPTELRGSKTGVFVGCSGSESFAFWSNNKTDINNYTLIGNALNMISNRVSFSFDFTGPSMTVDTACSSSGTVMHEAIVAMQRGDCDSAIVAGSNLSFHGWDNMRLGPMKLASPDGACKSFDAAADGYVRSETVAAVFLQRHYHANRVYATVIKTAANCDGYKEEGITYPKGTLQRRICEKAYSEAGVHPSELAYFEAHGSGTQAGDYEETTWVANYFGQHRKEPLLIGSTKSNVGHAEAASGLVSLVKILIAMETGVIPANLHFKTPNPRIPGLTDGRLDVVSTNRKWNGGIVGLNNFGFGGVNTHMILKTNDKEKAPPSKDGIPRLVCMSGRTEPGLEKTITKLESMPRDDDLITLFHKIHRSTILNHPVRGYTVLDGQSKMREIGDAKKSEKVWYVFSGMGAQWVGMGRSLMALKPFREAMERCAEALKPAGFDLFGMINSDDIKNLDFMANCATCITAIQVALIDILTLIGIKPDAVVGHSMGEIACGYADGTLTAEQAVLVSFWRGRCVDEDQSSPGAMAAVGLTWEEAKEFCAGTNVSAVCHNAADSVTISGPAPEVDKLVEKLTKAGKFARKVQSSGQALHTKYISAAGKKLLPILKQVIPNANPRSKIWVSSSVPEDKWDSEQARYASGEYLTNNLLQPVLFYEAVKMVPENSVVIEIGPHALFQSVLKKIVPPSCTVVGLAKSGVSDGLGFLLSSIGKLFIAGLNVDLSQLYPPPSLPVPRGTPMISPMIEWDHSVDWIIPSFDETAGDHIFMINPGEEPDSYMMGHKIDGRSLFPGTGYLTLVWQTLAQLKRRGLHDTPVSFDNVNFLRATIITNNAPVKIQVKIMEDTDEFQVIANGTLVSNGQVRVIDSIAKEGTPNLEKPAPPPESCVKALNGVKPLPMTQKDFYMALRKRGYEYGGQFVSIKECDHFIANAVAEWTGNWITFLDGMLQLIVCQDNKKCLDLPTRIVRLVIDPKLHLEAVKGKSEIDVQVYRDRGIVRTEGCEVKHLKRTMVPLRPDRKVLAREYFDFVPYLAGAELTFENALLRSLGIVIQNFSHPSFLKIVEIANSQNIQHLFAPTLNNLFAKIFFTSPKIEVATENPSSLKNDLDSIGVPTMKADVKTGPLDNSNSRHVVIGSEITEHLSNIGPALVAGGFVLSREKKSVGKDTISGFIVISEVKAEDHYYTLFRREEQAPTPRIVKISRDNFNWVETVKAAQSECMKTGQRVALVSDDSTASGLLGFFNCFKKEPGGELFRCVSNFDGQPISSSELNKQLAKNLKENIMKNGNWGSMQHFEIPKENIKPVEHAYVNTLTRGDLSSLRWIESNNGVAKLSTDHQLCSVYYAPLNFKDIMLASGKLPADALPGEQPEMECIMGLEFAGRDSKGKRVMGMMEAKAMATSVIVKSDALWSVPDSWTLEQASTIPVAYATSVYALIVRGGMKKGDRVLIHTGSGGVGLAAMHLAFHVGAEVFTTVGTDAKKEFLLKRFPQLDARNIGNSRDISFEQMIHKRTGGRGVDIVLNSLADEKLHASVRCLATKGRFLEIGKVDLVHNTGLGMAHFLKNISFHGILLDNIFEDPIYAEEKAKISKYIAEGIKSGAVQPLPVTTFESTELEQAFRYMATGKHIGKVVIKVRNDDGSTVKIPSPITVLADKKTYFNSEKSYIVAGGLGGLGIELCHFMLKRGARNIFLTTTRGVSDGYQAFRLREWSEKGFKNVVVYKAPVVSREEVTKLFDEAEKTGPIGGIFNLAGVLRDGFFEGQTIKNFEEVALSKITLTELFDTESRKRCPQLEYFVVYSSVSSGRGNPGQSNYGYANAVMERICENRQKDGLPATAIQWGPISGAGMVETLESVDGLILQGVDLQSLKSYVDMVDIALQRKEPVVSSVVIAAKKTAAAGSSSDLVNLIANVIGIKNVKGIAPASTLIELGMDSLMAAEIRQTLEREIDLLLDVKQIKELTFGRVLEIQEAAKK